jgi:hypothetical protein
MINGGASCRNGFKTLKILTMAYIYILEVLCFIRKYHMNIKYNCHVHKYDTRGSYDLHVSGCTISLYQNSVLNMSIKLFNKLPENKRLYTHLIIKKRAEINTFTKHFLYCRRILTGSTVVAVCIGNWDK